jgi:hypothetical protein
MVARILIVGAALVVGVQVPVVLKSNGYLDWSCYAALTSVFLYLAALAHAARGGKQSAKTAIAAVLVAGGFGVLMSPVPFLSPSVEMVAIIFGVVSLLVLVGRLVRPLAGRHGRRGWLFLVSGALGAGILFEAGSRRYALQFQTLSPGIADTIRWMWYIAVVLSLAAVLALASATGKVATNA